MRHSEFIEQANAAAAQSKYGFLPGVAIAQAALESNFGESWLSKTAKNYFGIKAHGKHPVMEFRTSEFVAKREVQVVARFAVYESMQECFECRDRQIANGAAYAKARAVKQDAEGFVAEMAKHWATDPRYSEKLLRIYRENGLDQLDMK